MRTLTTLALLALAAPMAAQEWPAGWETRLDRPDADASGVEFVTMEPGWHVTTGPAAILYHPDNTASGSYTVSADIYMFDPQGRREAFGVFVGGTDLQGPNQAYTYFLIREGGEFLVKRRHGDGTTTVQGWTTHDAIKAFGDRGADEASVLNQLVVQVSGDECSFWVNGAEMTTMPRGEMSLDGVIGLRVNHRNNLHVSKLEIEGGTGDR